MKKIILLTLVFLLTACGGQPASPSPTLVPPTPTILPTDTSLPPTETPLPTDTPAPVVPQDPTIFGAILQSEAPTGFALEPVANAIFVKAMDSLVASGAIQAYQVSRVTIFPGNGGLNSEIIFNVQTADPAWLADGGTQAADNWINDKCYRFDFVTTDSEFQLKNKRLCG